ncbi:MAG TPA: SAM-dependent chlorinase/fluorinase [Tepidisphaeraceae bacterium]|nr:SAM-dependent chlorinase/fluorinase [Tepidisphaeraceae bacterium]
MTLQSRDFILLIMRLKRRVVSTSKHRPLITLTTDFGLLDAYVATMKAAILRQVPEARLIDVTHNFPRHDILCGSITLGRAIDGFPAGTIHLAVIDPGVGTSRRMLVAEINRQLIVCPDNGLITWSWRTHAGSRASELTWRPKNQASNVFHGRDIMAPVAGMIGAGRAIDQLARPIDDPILLDVAPAMDHERRGEIIHIDHFGNATTNIGHDALRAHVMRGVKVKGKNVGKLKKTYWDVAPGKPLALIGSSGLLEIAVRDGSAATDLKLRVGDPVKIELVAR